MVTWQAPRAVKVSKIVLKVPQEDFDKLVKNNIDCICRFCSRICFRLEGVVPPTQMLLTVNGDFIFGYKKNFKEKSWDGRKFIKFQYKFCTFVTKVINQIFVLNLGPLDYTKASCRHIFYILYSETYSGGHPLRRAPLYNRHWSLSQNRIT